MTQTCATLDLDAFEATRAAVAADPQLGRGTFRATTSWRDGTRAQTVARTFAVETDEPTALGGTDRAIDPMELVLTAIGACLTIGWVTHAAQRGVRFRDLRVEVEGDYDLRGYLALDEQTRPGFSAFRYAIHVDTDAPDATLEEIRRAVEAGSPVVDNLVNSSPLTGAVARRPA